MRSAHHASNICGSATRFLTNSSASPPKVGADKLPKRPPFTPIPKELADGPVEAWDGYFAKSTPSPRAVALRVQELQDARKHDHIVALLEAALLHGQSQPWMYDALAISMEAIGRPVDEKTYCYFPNLPGGAAGSPRPVHRGP